MAPDLPVLAASLQESEFVENERIDDLEFDLNSLEAVIDAYEAAFGRNRAQSFVEYRSAVDTDSRFARCPALDDLLEAMDASGEDECRQAGIFRSYTNSLSKAYSARSQRQFPSAELI
jgi:hypothetical protein